MVAGTDHDKKQGGTVRLWAKLAAVVRAVDPARRRARRYDHPDAHRRTPHNPDAAIVRHHVPGNHFPPGGNTM